MAADVLNRYEQILHIIENMKKRDSKNGLIIRRRALLQEKRNIELLKRVIKLILGEDNKIINAGFLAS